MTISPRASRLSFGFAAAGLLLLAACSADNAASDPPVAPAPSDPPAPVDPITPGADASATTPTGEPDAAAPPPGTKTTGTGSYQSNLTDFAITVKDVGARLSPPAAASAGGFKSTLKLYLVDYAGYCADYGKSIGHAGSRNVKLEIEKLGATAGAATLGPGTFVIDHLGDGDGEVYIGRQSLDAKCSSSKTPLPFTLAGATANEVVITRLDAAHVTGTYELQSADGRFIKGSFDADLCTASPTGASVCQ